MHKLTILSLILVLAGCSDRSADNAARANAEAGKKYIGFVHGALPDNMQRTGWVLLDSLGGHDYALTGISAGLQQMIWLDESVPTDSTVSWKVVDVLAFDSLKADESVQPGTCTAPDISAKEVIALTRRPAPRAAATVEAAWHINRQAKRFDVLHTSGVVCK